MKNLMTKKTAMKYWKEWRLTLFLIVFVILPVKSSLADFNCVPTGSLKPTILEGAFVFVNKAAYGLRVPLTRVHLARWANPERGDIVICFSPDDGTRLTKRVVGLPGGLTDLLRDYNLAARSIPLDTSHRVIVAKTGTMDYVRGLAGLIAPPSRRRPVSAILRDVRHGRGDGRRHRRPPAAGARRGARRRPGPRFGVDGGGQARPDDEDEAGCEGRDREERGCEGRDCEGRGCEGRERSGRDRHEGEWGLGSYRG